ncbi:protein associated with UVRAG as autophagy enhancer [Garra rufa]|uniref:protein associated with UVRAG as autophagy enhancer n=1 Tax=Garra rufa TaxID=137080 RepID=UPI003CCE9977
MWANAGKSCGFVSWLLNSDLNDNHSDSSDDDDDDIDESGLKVCECNAPVAEWDLGLFEPEEEYYLPRSSPVISRKRHNTETEKQAGLSLTPPIWELSISPSVKSNCSSPHRLVESSCSEKDRNLDHCDSSKDSSGQTQFLSDNHCTGISPVSRDTHSHSFVSGQLHEGFQSKTKRACTDIPPAAGQRSSDQAKKHGSCVDHSTADLYSLDQENAHFVVVDMLLEMLEAVKWVVCLQQLKSTHPHQDRCETQYTSKTDSIYSFDSGFEGKINRYSLASFQSCLQSSRIQRSAEDLAHHLVSKFRKQWFPSELLQNPDNLNSALQEVSVHIMVEDRMSLTEEIVQKTRMRGTLTWAPPRFQIIFCVQPTHRRSDVIASQHFLCAGCGTKIEPRYMKKLRYCDYLGRYFCDGCHGGLESVIPGRVLNNWDFTRHPVCHFSRQILDSIWQQPLFKLTSVAKKLYSQAKELQRFRELQEQLISIKKLLSTCRLSTGVLDEFEQLPAHLMQELHLFSMDDLIRVKKGQLCTIAKALMQSAIIHINICELCQAKGFICEFCHREEVLFPFQRDTCTRCQDCRACFHISCFRDESCPKCARLQKRKKLQEDINL